MRRVVRLRAPRANPILTAIVSMAVSAGVVFVVPAAAQDLPPCNGVLTSSCALSDWTDAADGTVESPFGEVDGVVWVDDGLDDAPAAGLDIRSVGLGRVNISDPASIRKSEALLKLGGRKKAVRGGPHILVRVVLDRPLEEIDDGHAGVHVATDVDGSRANNAPAGAGMTVSPFAGLQDIFSLTYAVTADKTRLLKSDLAKGWYKAKGPYAAMWAAPNVLDIVTAPQDFGDGFRVVTFVSGANGGYDRVDLGPTPIPSNGRVGFVASCVEAVVSSQPFTVRRLIENGQTLRDVEAPSSWRGGARFPVDGPELDALRALITTDEGTNGTIAIGSTVSLFEDGLVIRQRPDILLRLDGSEAQLSLELGLTRRGYNVLRDIEPQATGEPTVDVWLKRATDALVESMPPFRMGKRDGFVAGEGAGECLAEPGAVGYAGPTATG